ncbi:MAG: metal ABC transporter permease [Cytophagaceae bacterium]|jgi:zinc transport system permease protein|nr:metal ABC transporter permease [Cytophagaceae bacterium]
MNDLISLFDYLFFRNAVIATILTGILAAMTGTYIVSRKIVFISGGITHASFGGIGMAYYLGLNPFLGAATFSILSALGVEWISNKAKIREDSAIAILWSFGMAIGIIFVFLTPGYTPNLMSFLFGSILSVGTADLWMVAALAAVTALFMTVFYRPVVYSAFDPEFSKTMGVRVNFYRYAMSILIACSIVISIRTMGIILVLSLFTIPQSTAMLFTKEFHKIIFLSIIFGIAGSLLGLFSSYAMNIPSGASIIFGLTALYFFFKAVVVIWRFVQKQ